MGGVLLLGDWLPQGQSFSLTHCQARLTILSMKGNDVEDFKSVFQSKTVWSCLFVLAAMGLHALGFTFNDADQAALSDAVLKGVEVVGTIAAIIFRVKATKVIS